MAGAHGGTVGAGMPRSRRPRRAHAAGAVVAGALLVSWCVGCTSVVRPPEGPLQDPITVFVTFDDRHRGLLLPRQTAAWVEYGYGEYAWYAENRDAWYRVFPTVLWPTRGTLSRREVQAGSAAELSDALWWMELHPLRVERADAARVLAELDREFERHRDAMIQNHVYRKEFVPADRSYWCFFNCHDAIAGWLVELGCAVSWVPIRVDLVMAEAK